MTQPSLTASLGDLARSSSIAVSQLQLSNQKDNIQLTIAFGAENGNWNDPWIYLLLTMIKQMATTAALLENGDYSKKRYKYQEMPLHEIASVVPP